MAGARMRVLVLSHPGRIGDLVLVQPVLAAIAADVGEPTIPVSPMHGQVLEAFRGTYRLDAPRPYRRWRELTQEARRLRGEGFGAAVIARPSFRAALLTRMARIPVRVGEPSEGRGMLLTCAVRRTTGQSERAFLASLARAAGARDVPDWPQLRVSDDERVAGALHLDGATIGISPGASWPAKRFRPDVVVDLVRRWNERGERVALLGGPAETSVREELRELDAELPVVDVIGAMSLRETLGALHTLPVVVAPDGGLAHMAVGCGARVVTAFGPTDPVRWGHSTPPHRVVTAPGRDMAKLELDAVDAAVAQSLDEAKSAATRR